MRAGRGVLTAYSRLTRRCIAQTGTATARIERAEMEARAVCEQAAHVESTRAISYGDRCGDRAQALEARELLTRVERRLVEVEAAAHLQVWEFTHSGVLDGLGTSALTSTARCSAAQECSTVVGRRIRIETLSTCGSARPRGSGLPRPFQTRRPCSSVARRSPAGFAALHIRATHASGRRMRCARSSAIGNRRQRRIRWSSSACLCTCRSPTRASTPSRPNCKHL